MAGNGSQALLAKPSAHSDVSVSDVRMLSPVTPSLFSFVVVVSVHYM